MDDYRQYLAQQILTEDKLVTYRVLSRALKVKVNTAKEMLYEFHKWQNDKKPGSLHATYLVYGSRKPLDDQDGDVEMTNSQLSDDYPPVRFSDEVHTETLTLVKEEQLDETLKQYDEIRSIHVYSIGSHPLKDLQLLADTARQVLSQSSPDDLAASAKVYGSISNPNVRSRERRGAGPSKAAASTPAVKAESKTTPAMKQEPKPAAASTPAAVKEEPKAAQPSGTKPSAPLATKRTSAAAPALKRQGSSSGIGQMFAKAAAKPKKPAAPKPAEEEPSPAMSDDGADDADEDQPMEDAKPEETAAARRSRSDRQAALRRMMDDSDEEKEPSEADTPHEDDRLEEEEEAAAAQEPEPKAEEPSEEVSSTGNGRKRGRRRVTKKKQVMDDQGYLVTIQEQGWESFSEDEAPPAAKSKTTTSTSSAASSAKADATAKPKKPAGKAGQGNIMSFFSKK